MHANLSRPDKVFKALGDSTRLRILGLLLSGEVCVGDICESLGIPQPKASRHLAALKRAGLVEGRKDGLFVHYRFAEPTDPAERTLLSYLRHAISHLPTAGDDRRRLERLTGPRPTVSAEAPEELIRIGIPQPRAGLPHEPPAPVRSPGSGLPLSLDRR